MSRLDGFVRLYKQGMERGDPGRFAEELAAIPPAERSGFRNELMTFLSAERARLVKMRTLGLATGFDEKLRYTESLMALVGEDER